VHPDTVSIRKIEILGQPINDLDYSKLLDIISFHISNHSRCLITYANVHNLNLIQEQPVLQEYLEEFEIIHSDGIGVYLASKFLYGKKGLKNRFVGSDFYELLCHQILIKKWSTFFLGGNEITLNRIRIVNPELNITGLQNGFEFDNNILLERIKILKPDIIFVGMGFPKQELWIAENRNSISNSVVIAIGDGIKVFSKTKVRGPAFMRKLGFEWLFRLLHEPKRLWKRYILGNPLFLYRIFKDKMINLFKG
jgi:N-acetylglucosaminyldiphosphoundecaprenol N-acetyl-beta-D-mannosaminyltransferase